MRHIQLTNDANQSYKIGVDEIVGLKDAMTEVMKPIKSVLKDKIYWDDLDLNSVEYKSRDGFIAHSHNCGGIELSVILPKCEEYEFSFVEFGECDGCADDGSCLGDDSLHPENGGECGYESDSLLDAFLRIRLKFEGYDKKTGELSFYLFAEGGNNDAPYYRNVPTLFEAEFTCKSVAGLKQAASKHITKLIKLIE